ncbi:MAG: hypothetical protein G01um101418_957 [Parcubacteria group bacterium Gr01-1014_18]|nr:MAG: hypothetical protein Greene041636_959 [Parcubacteria group bacterium Greene0416_36]TSC79696.1 MAG: hypothetical protein G01um101418_957 [Parcubacteria group bacterium Gr01-1014_18]TSC97856.1 MAG: hypothetical protein Greene101420_961 [Parcubacteria group bacterium Greene1014_20]TSD06480.1 MAG: hypothetical protein Greene07142_861 [Parcubacteria group bacterium Greene0714_2]
MLKIEQIASICRCFKNRRGKLHTDHLVKTLGIPYNCIVINRPIEVVSTNPV